MTRLTLIARRLAVVVVAVGLALGLAAPVAWAHVERPASTTTLEAGPYTLAVARYADPPRAGQEFEVVVTPAPGSAAPDVVRLVARPGLGTNATPTRSVLAPDPDASGSDEFQKRYANAIQRDFDGDAKRVTEMDALVAYLQMLGTLVDFKHYDHKANLR